MTDIKPENKFNAPMALDPQLLVLFEDFNTRIYKLELAVSELSGQRPPTPPAPK